jgi:hypothetical protein
MVGVKEAMSADRRMIHQSDHGLWSRDVVGSQ